jgi:DNA polymerase III gamma/tau subunit
MRRLLESLRFAPLVKKGSPSIRVFILDEFHRASGNAQDCILKPLEQPDKSTYFIICTTEPAKVIKTIKSRCTQWEVSPLDSDEMKTLLEWVVESEEKNVAEEVIEKIIEVAEGTPRNALKLLDSVLDIKKTSKALELIVPAAELPETIELCRILIRCEKGMWSKVAKILREIKVEPEKIRLAVLGYLTSVMIKDVKKAPMIFMMADELKEPLHYNGSSGLRMQLFAICSLFES